MYSKNWHVIKDDTRKTFEVVGQGTNDNAFSNRVIAMQRSGMNVSAYIPPVTNKNASKEMIQITGYKREDGLFDRLYKELAERNRQSIDFDDGDS